MKAGGRSEAAPDTLSHAFPIGASMLPGSEGVYTGTPHSNQGTVSHAASWGCAIFFLLSVQASPAL